MAMALMAAAKAPVAAQSAKLPTVEIARPEGSGFQSGWQSLLAAMGAEVSQTAARADEDAAGSKAAPAKPDKAASRQPEARQSEAWKSGRSKTGRTHGEADTVQTGGAPAASSDASLATNVPPPVTVPSHLDRASQAASVNESAEGGGRARSGGEASEASKADNNAPLRRDTPAAQTQAQPATAAAAHDPSLASDRAFETEPASEPTPTVQSAAARGVGKAGKGQMDGATTAPPASGSSTADVAAEAPSLTAMPLLRQDAGNKGMDEPRAGATVANAEEAAMPAVKPATRRGSAWGPAEEAGRSSIPAAHAHAAGLEAANGATGWTGGGAATNGARSDGPSTSPPPAGGESVAALDGESRVQPFAIHGSSRHAEAGFQDSALGWIGVRAALGGGGIHAAVVPDSAAAAEVLATHMAGLHSYLDRHQSAVETLTMAAPGSGDGQNRGQDRDRSADQPQGAIPERAVSAPAGETVLATPELRAPAEGHISVLA